MIPQDKANYHNRSDLHKPFDFDLVYQAFSSTNDLFDISQEILDLVIHMTGAEKCSLMMINGHGELYVLNSRGIEQSLTRSCRVKIGEGVAGKIAAEGQPVLVQDISSDSRFAIDNRSKYRSGSFIACPISSKEEVIGVLNINDKRDGQPFGSDEFDQAKLIAMIAATALRNFLDYNNLMSQRAEVEDIINQLFLAEKENRDFTARMSLDTRAPLNNIKGAVYYLKKTKKSTDGRDQELYEIIEKEVNFLISYLSRSIGVLEQKHQDILRGVVRKHSAAWSSVDQKTKARLT